MESCIDGADFYEVENSQSDHPSQSQEGMYGIQYLYNVAECEVLYDAAM